MGKRRLVKVIQYTTIYNISTEPYERWIWFGLTGLIGVAALYSFGRLTERKPGTYPHRYWVMGFCLVVAFIAGLSVRISYLTDKQIDDGSLENRILKFLIRQ